MINNVLVNSVSNNGTINKMTKEGSTQCDNNNFDNEFKRQKNVAVSRLPLTWRTKQLALKWVVYI